jgi:hypothetical protein
MTSDNAASAITALEPPALLADIGKRIQSIRRSRPIAYLNSADHSALDELLGRVSGAIGENPITPMRTRGVEKLREAIERMIPGHASDTLMSLRNAVMEIVESLEQMPDGYSRSWKRLEAEKAQVRAIQAELQKRIEDAEKASDPTSPAKPDELRKFAREWEEEGRDDLAKAARAQAEKLEGKLRRDTEMGERKFKEFNETWSASVNRMISEHPELKDESSDLGRRVISLLKSEDAELRKLINATPNGFVYATQIAKMQKAAEDSEALRTEIESLRKENGELRKKTSLSASGSQKPAKRKSFDEMDSRQQEAFLRSMAVDSDAGVLTGE